MKKQVRLLKMAGLVSLLMGLLLVGVAYAITITVDGDEESVWTTGANGQTPGSATDPNEGGITDNRDISHIFWTNDGSNYYFMMRTHGLPPSLTSFPVLTQIFFCIDTDNNTSTGSSFGNCNSMSGIDRYIFISGTSAPQVFNGSFSLLGTGTLGYNTGATNPVIELSIPNSLLGFDSSNCTQTMPMVVYFDNGTTDPDDNTPDSSTTNIGCGSPTAITLTDLRATPGANAALVGAAGLVLLGTAFLLFRRSRKHATATIQED